MHTPQPGTWHHAQETYSLFPGIERCKQRICELLQGHSGTVIVQVAGGSASGKTSKVTQTLKTSYPEASVLSMDDYYRGKVWMQEEREQGREYNFDQPEALNMTQIQQHLHALKNGKSILKPIYCMKTSTQIGTEHIQPSPLVIMEGLFALSDELHTTGDLNIFVQADTATRLWRRVMRDQKRAHQSPEEILAYFRTSVEPMHQKYVEGTMKNAHIILKNTLQETPSQKDDPTYDAVTAYLNEKDFVEKLMQNTDPQR